MINWFWYAIVAAVLYGLHQVFTKMAANHVGDGIGGFIVEVTAAITIAIYLGWLSMSGKWDQRVDGFGVFYCLLTGICVGAGTIAFFLLFQRGGPLSAVPMALAAGAALMGTVGILFMKEPASWSRLLGIALSIAGLYLLRLSPEK
jgi:transporter family protein